MKILIYSDLHISRTSSIIPTGNNTKYTYRQNMIIETGKYLANLVETEKPDIIINDGDTFDQHTITSYDIDVASEFFKCFEKFNIPHYVLVGNHEMVNQSFNAVALLNNIANITVIDEPTTINNLAFLPYCDYKDILEFPEGEFLFSHQDIQGSKIRGDFELPDGISNDILQQKYKLVFNGHIHKPSIMNNVINVGSISTHSFSDDEESVPQCYIFDTETMDLKTFKPAICPLFRKFEINNSLDELKLFVNNLNQSYKYLLHIVCPFEIKDETKEYLNNTDIILNSRLNIKTVKTTSECETENINLQSSIDVSKSFEDFLNLVELRYPKEIYLNVLKEVSK